MKNALLKAIGVALVIVAVFGNMFAEAIHKAASFFVAEPIIATRVIIFLVGLAMIYPQIFTPAKKLVRTLSVGKEELEFILYLRDRAQRNKKALEDLIKEIKVSRG